MINTFCTGLEHALMLLKGIMNDSYLLHWLEACHHAFECTNKLFLPSAESALAFDMPHLLLNVLMNYLYLLHWRGTCQHASECFNE
jgi:hypothetical protein